MLVTTLCLVILVVAAWPACRLLSLPSFRRWYGCFALRVSGLLVLYLLGISAVARWFPGLLPIGAAIGVIGLVLERWRARPGHGRARNLPPGSLALVPRGPWVDEAYFRGQAARYGRVFKMSHLLRPMICIVGTQRGLALFRENYPNLRAPLVRFSTFIPGGFIRHMEQERHQEYRRVLQSGLGHTFTDELRARMETRVCAGIDAMANASQEAGSQGVQPRGYIEDLLLGLFVEVFTGIDRESAEGKRLLVLYPKIDIRKAGCGSRGDEVSAAREIAAIIAKQGDNLVSASSTSVVGDAAAAPSDVAASSLLAQILVSEPDRRTDETLLLNLVYMIQVGRLDMAGLLGWVVKMLVDHPFWLERIREEAAQPVAAVPAVISGRPSRESSSLAARVVKETLRLEQSEYLFRRATEDLQFEGFLIPKGWLIRVCIRDGHRDPEIFHDPDRFDPDRFLDPGFPAEAYSPLGFLQRGCLGGRLIELIGVAFVTYLATRFDIEKRADGPREYGRAHWEPSSRLRLRLTAHPSLVETSSR